MEEKTASIWKSSLIYSIYLGTALILITVIYYVTGNIFAKSSQYISFPIMIFGLIWAQINFNKALNNEMKYGQAFGIGLLTMFFTSVITSIFTLVLYQIIDPTLQEQLRIYTEEQIMQNGIPQERVEMAVEMAAKFQTPLIMTIMGLVTGFFLGLIFSIISTSIFGMWKIYEKANQPGWSAIVPIYNMIILVRIINKPSWWVILFFIPIINLVFLIWAYNLLAKCFGKDTGFTVGLVLLGFIFFPILGFGDSEYTKPELL